MDEPHALAAARYIELNPVRAGLAARPEDWPWSSARAHLTGRADGLTRIAALDIGPRDWRGFLSGGLDDADLETIRKGERTGRPLGDAAFVSRLEAQTGRELAPRKPGPKPASQDKARSRRSM
jgi:putative transposase